MILVPIWASQLFTSLGLTIITRSFYSHPFFKVLALMPHVATLANSPLLTWSFFRLSKGYEC
jgi:hypothetical protein